MRAILAVAAVLAALPALAQKLPQYVAGPLSGLAHDCQQAKQPVDTAAMVTSIDLDGDGTPDHLIDSRKGCPAVRDLYCTAAGACSLDIYLSRTQRQEGSYKVLEFEVVPGHTVHIVRMLISGQECGPAASCGRVLVWRNDKLNLTR